MDALASEFCLATLAPQSHLLTGQTDETEFLPAALEIIETPPSPAGRIIAGDAHRVLRHRAVLGDASARSISSRPRQGKIVPTGRTKVIQPLESGVVHAIHVQDGQQVKGGRRADRNRHHHQRRRARPAAEANISRPTLDAARLKAALEPRQRSAARLHRARRRDGRRRLRLQKTLLANQVDEIRAKLSGLDRQIAQNQATAMRSQRPSPS